jgi:AraC-like DNA-binding protein
MLIHEGTELFPSFSVIHANAGSTAYRPGGTYGPRQQLYYQLVLLDAGYVDIAIDGVNHRLNAGQVALLQPGHEERFKFASDQGTWHRWIHLQCETCTLEDKAKFGRLPVALPLEESISQLTNQMIAIQGPIRGQATDGVLRALGLSALLHYVTQSFIKQQSRSLHPAVIHAMELIRHHYKTSLHLNQIANETGVTPEHLIRLFRRDIGTTPSKYIWLIRTKRGLEMLRVTGLSVSEIAEQAGFQSSYHFARMIKAETGVTPTEIRRQSLRGAPLI